MVEKSKKWSRNKYIFIEALLVASVIFLTGIFLGSFYEKARVDSVREFYVDSETGLSDFELSSQIIYDFNLNCSFAIEKSIYFADQIYKEARQLEKYDSANKFTSDVISLHRRYDLLRTLLWKNMIQNKEKCSTSASTIVYLYDYIDTSLTTQSMQTSISNILLDVKGEYGDKVILIPIAADTNVEALSILREYYDLDKVPIVIVNEKYQFDNIEDLKNIRDYLI